MRPATNLMGSKEGAVGLGHLGLMNGDQPRAMVFRALECVLHLVIGFAFILASILPAQAMPVSRIGGHGAQAIALHDHCKSFGDQSQNGETHSVCMSVSCQALAAAQETSFRPRPHVADFDPARFKQLLARVTAPPLPPPRIIILA